MSRHRPPRVVIAKIGLDGHDRGAKLIVRNLRDAGMEVIYTGLWQTPASTVHAALQEDADVLGVSLLSAAHMTVMPEVLRLCRDNGIADLPVIVGGIIPEQDHQPMRDMGCAAVFNPGSSMAYIVETLTKLALARRESRAKETRQLELRTPNGLARAITLVMDDYGGDIKSTSTVRAIRVGVTGSAGVGKSTFIGKLAQQLRERGKRVAVIAVDPTSPVTGGSLLGDRLRMMRNEPDHDLFVRSLSSAGQAGGLGPHVNEIADLFSAAGFDIVLIETVGAGQNDVAIRDVAKNVLLLLMPGAGDAVQFEKAGIVEIATGFVVNKADLPGADKTIKDLRNTLEDDRPIWSVSALRGEGLAPLCEWIETRGA